MAFLFKLETVESKPADPPTLSAAVPNWNAGDTIHLGRKTLRVVGRFGPGRNTWLEETS
jgi:hypothetical protein